MLFYITDIIAQVKRKIMQIKKLLLVPFTILLGIFLGYLSHNTQKEKRAQIYEEKAPKTIQYKDLHTPKFLSNQIINHKSA